MSSGALPPTSQPILTWKSISVRSESRQNQSIRSLFDWPTRSHYFISARYALYYALQNENIGQGDEVLIPAYHCDSMVSPVVALGATPKFFPLTQKLHIEPELLTTFISASTRAIIAPHYFGFTQNFSALRDWCSGRNIVFVEDCAHAFFSHNRENPPGIAGDYAIGSVKKFFPVYDGGILICNKRPFDRAPIQRPSTRFTVKAAANILERGLMHKKFGALNPLLNFPFQAKQTFSNLFHDANTHVAAISPAAADGGDAFEIDWASTSMTPASRWIADHANVNWVCAQRRKHYNAYRDFFNTQSDCELIFPDLEDDTVPYLFPVRLPDCETFYRLKSECQIPTQSFGRYRSSLYNHGTCPVSDDFGKNVLQFPVHEALSESDLDWMLSRTNAILKALT